MSVSEAKFSVERRLLWVEVEERRRCFNAAPSGEAVRRLVEEVFRKDEPPEGMRPSERAMDRVYEGLVRGDEKEEVEAAWKALGEDPGCVAALVVLCWNGQAHPKEAHEAAERKLKDGLAEKWRRCCWGRIEGRWCLRAYMLWAEESEDKGDLEGAVGVLRQMLELDEDDHIGARYMLLRLLLLLEHWEEALQLLERFAEDASLEFGFGRGLALIFGGREDEGIRMVGRAAQMYPWVGWLIAGAVDEGAVSDSQGPVPDGFTDRGEALEYVMLWAPVWKMVAETLKKKSAGLASALIDALLCRRREHPKR